MRNIQPKADDSVAPEHPETCDSPLAAVLQVLALTAARARGRRAVRSRSMWTHPVSATRRRGTDIIHRYTNGRIHAF